MRSLDEKQKQYIRENRLLGPTVLSRKVNKSRSCVQRFMKQENIQLTKEETRTVRVKASTGRTTFTPQMDEFLKQNYLTMPTKTLGDHIGKSYCALKIRMRQLNLLIPPEIVERNKKNSQFQKGSTPHNKGRKISEYMSKKNQQKIKKTQFKDGHKPYNMCEVGEVREFKDSSNHVYLIKKTANPDKWRFLHHLVYEEYHKKKIPAGKIVIFKDRDSSNLDPENLEAITKAQNALRNKMSFEALPPTMKRVIKLNNKINRKLCEI